MTFAWRYFTVVLLSAGLAIIYGLKVNLSVAIVSMVNHSAVAALHEEDDNTPRATTCDTKMNGPFIWSKSMQGNLLSSYFWGYMVAMFPGSQLAEVVSAKWCFFFAVAVNIACTMATPIASKTHYALVFSLRVIQGIGGGVTFPTTHVILANWAPPTERSVMSSIAFSGTLLGTVLSNYISGLVGGNLGWKWIFYVMGFASMPWLFLWVLFASDKPDQLRFVNQIEVKYIESCLGVGHDHVKMRHVVPWLSISKSKPFWALLVAHASSTVGFYILLTQMPFFMKTVLNFNMCQISIHSALPYFGMLLLSLATGETLTILKRKNKISNTWARKSATLIASVGPMLCLTAMCISVEQPTWLSLTFLYIALTTIGAQYSGFLTNHIDLSPNFAGTLMGLTNTIATIPGIVGPMFVGAITQKNATMESWRIIFGLICAFYLVEIVVFTLLGSGEEQPWNKPVYVLPAEPGPEVEQAVHNY